MYPESLIKQQKKYKKIELKAVIEKTASIWVGGVVMRSN